LYNSEGFIRQAVCIIPGVACILSFLMSLTINHKKLRRNKNHDQQQLLPNVAADSSSTSVDVTVPDLDPRPLIAPLMYVYLSVPIVVQQEDSRATGTTAPLHH
jgi:hypothetical protein